MLKKQQLRRRQAKSRRRGFTIIEVVLVLAIAGLIFLLIFLALPALQRAQRDQQRRSDLAEALAAVTNWRTVNRGGRMDSQAKTDDLRDKFFSSRNDPLTNEPYAILYYNWDTPHPDVPQQPFGTIYYVAGHVCGSDADTYPNGQPSLVTGIAGFTEHDLSAHSVLIRLENTNSAYCLDNN